MTSPIHGILGEEEMMNGFVLFLSGVTQLSLQSLPSFELGAWLTPEMMSTAKGKKKATLCFTLEFIPH